MVKEAADSNLAESDDLDWKQSLPRLPEGGQWNELAEDVAAMANTRRGLLIYGVTDHDTTPVGIDLDEVNTQQYGQWIRNHVQPHLPDVTYTPLTSPGGTLSLMAPHDVYGTATKDKDQQAAVVPYRDADHTAWMSEHQIDAPTDRFTRIQNSQEETDRLLEHVRENVFPE
ncbi:ATP-binding protein [Streptomyces sp. NPDC046939]|uniref:AlbA family DNA-binding domain-containing protein n=1 Tax=Streptomyces sp. NPDC046939 TaxID=3155376 RepID=UPI0033F132FD